jgi:hypothetical protein
MGWDRWKRIFFVGAGIWLSGTIILQIARSNSRSYSSILLIDNLNTLFAVLSIGVLVLGLVLFSRWVWLKTAGSQIVRRNQSPAERPRAVPEVQPSATWATRWAALVEYDDEIRPAAEKLLPYGPDWVERLGEAFYALKEDRSYLGNIVERLLNEAKLNAANEWKTLFTRTADGEFTSKESLAVLLEAQESGYKLGTQSNGAFTVSKSSSTSMLYSNEDIPRFGQILAGRSR